MTVEVFNDHSTDHETEANAICVYLFPFILVGSEQHEHVLMVCLFNTLTCVFDRYSNVLILVWLRESDDITIVLICWVLDFLD